MTPQDTGAQPVTAQSGGTITRYLGTLSSVSKNMPIVNTATVNGEDWDGDGLTPAQDDHELDVVHDAGTLRIVKDGPATAYHGDSVTYTYDVTYTSPDGSPAIRNTFIAHAPKGTPPFRPRACEPHPDRRPSRPRAGRSR